MINRTRRLRNNPAIRSLVAEHQLTVDDLIYPLFIEEGQGIKTAINAMPGIYRYSLDMLQEELDQLVALGIKAVLLFGIPQQKDAIGAVSWQDNNIIEQAIKYIKANYPSLYLISDLCFCEYTEHGHCGVLDCEHLVNDQSVDNLKLQALNHAAAGVDMIAPSGMLDGTIAGLRSALDQAGYINLPIMGYSVKYASAFYGPFREAAGSTPSFGDRKSYQMDPANRKEALVRANYEDQEGVDILMVKPALAYLDIVADLAANFNKPIACYNVSGEYSMIKLAGQAGVIDPTKVMLESLLSMKRAGASLIISYFAKEVAQILQDQ